MGGGGTSHCLYAYYSLYLVVACGHEKAEDQLCERLGLPVPNRPHGLCGRKATLNERDELMLNVLRCHLTY